MRRRSEEEQIVITYLLGEIGESERDKIEDRYFHDREYHEFILSLEEELTLNYLHGNLTRKEKGRIEGYFLSSVRRRAKFELTKHMVAYADQFATSFTRDRSAIGVSGWLSWHSRFRADRLRLAWSVVAIAILTMGGGWLFLNLLNNDSRSRLKGGGVVKQDSPAPPTPTETKQPVPTGVHPITPAGKPSPVSRKPKVSSTTLTVTINLSDVRSNDSFSEISIPVGITNIQLQIPLIESDYSVYNVVIKTTDGEEIFRRHNLKGGRTKSGEMITLTLATRRLRKANYVLDLYGVANSSESKLINESFFRVINK